MKIVRVALVGYGYWGPNLARNFSRQPGCQLMAICDARESRLEAARLHHHGVRTTTNSDELMRDPEIDAILIATPVSSHYALAMAALENGKDVLVEKPLTATATEAARLVDLARRTGRILAVDHTFLFTGAVRKIKDLSDSGELGNLAYLDSVRINLGLFQHDVNVIYDLAPHDLSILAYLKPEDPVEVQAHAMHYRTAHLESSAYVHMAYADGMFAHFHLSWLSPVKIRRTLIAGDKKMVVYDDTEITEKVKIYDMGVSLSQPADDDSLNKILVDYRIGDMVAPKVAQREALDLEAEHFLDCVRTRKPFVSDGAFGLRICRMLDACAQSVAEGGKAIRLEPVA